MKAVRIHEFGGPDVMKLEDLPKPKPGRGEVLIQVQAAGVNPVDYKIREGKYPVVKAENLPITLGRDAAGLVRAFGEGAKGYAEGDEVFVMLPNDRGGYAEWVTAPVEACALKPKSLDMVQAASVPLAALTAWQGLFNHGHLKAGQKVLIHGASGGVGPYAVQFARHVKAEVYATGSADQKAFIESLGAERAIDYKDERFEDIVQDIDLVYDMIGGETQDRSWSVLKPGGVLICTVQEPDQNKARAHKVTAKRYTCQPDGGQLREIGKLIDAGEIKVKLDRIFPLSQAAAAETHLEKDHVVGKVVLEVGSD